MNFLEVFRRYKTLSEEEKQMMFVYWSPILQSYKIFSKKQAKYLDSPIWDNHKLFRINEKPLMFIKHKQVNKVSFEQLFFFK